MRNTYRFKPAITIILVLALSLMGLQVVLVTGTTDNLYLSHEKATTHLVTRIIDGDTIVVDHNTTIRLIGIDAPERGDPGFDQATQALREKVNNRYVRAVKDTRETDDYGRLLRYIYIDDTLVNESLVKEGFARATPFPPDTSRAYILKTAQDYAKENNLGLWE